MRMVIGLVCDEYPPARIAGGIGTYTRSLARLLAESTDHDVHVFCQKDGLEKPVFSEKLHEVETWLPRSRPLRYAYPRLARFLFGPIERRIRWGVSVAVAIKAVERALDRTFDVIEVPEAGGYGAILRYAGIKTPMLVRLHTSTLILREYSKQPVSLEDRLVGLLERRSAQKADAISSPSRALVRESRRALAFKKDCLIYPNIPPPFSRGTSESRRRQSLLVVGRLGHLKGTDLVLRAVGDLQAHEYEDLRLRLLGRSEWPEHQLRDLAGKWMRQGSWEWIGEVDHREVTGALRSSTILIQASRFENYPTAILEAMQAGCMVLASNAGGIPEVITDGTTGLLFESGSLEHLKVRLRWALDHPDEVERIASAALRWAGEVLSPDRLKKSVTNAYRQAIEMKPG